jgi:hypothetical protein
MGIVSPVFGFLPVRGARSTTEKLPNPVRVTRLPSFIAADKDDSNPFNPRSAALLLFLPNHKKKELSE